MRVSPRILYVDDDLDSCELMGLLLERDDEEYEVVSVRTAEKAIALMNDFSFDLYILDSRLPDSSGVELCCFIRKISQSAPVMFFSAMARPADRNAAMNAGANAYLVKPNDLDELSPTVRRLLAESMSFPVAPVAA